MSEIKIRDLYTGKPDAKDEINFEGLEEFIKTFVVADHFQLDSLLYGNNCFITGFKGTGKTALLFYLDNKLKDEDSITCTSFIFFKEEFTDAKRDELQAISNRFLSSISVEPGALLDIREFEYIWRYSAGVREGIQGAAGNSGQAVDYLGSDPHGEISVLESRQGNADTAGGRRRRRRAQGHGNRNIDQRRHGQGGQPNDQVFKRNRCLDYAGKPDDHGGI